MEKIQQFLISWKVEVMSAILFIDKNSVSTF